MHRMDWARFFCPLNAFVSIFWFSSRSPNVSRAVSLRIFYSINLILMTFVSNQTHTVTKGSHYWAKTVPFFLFVCSFVSQLSRCYHFIIRPKNNKNKSLMLCFTLLSIEYWFCVPLNCSVRLVLLLLLLLSRPADVHRYSKHWCESKPQSEYQKTAKKNDGIDEREWEKNQRAGHFKMTSTSTVIAFP